MRSWKVGDFVTHHCATRYRAVIIAPIGGESVRVWVLSPVKRDHVRGVWNSRDLSLVQPTDDELARYTMWRLTR